MSDLVTENLPLLAGAPNGIKKLRELILELAMRGKLVPQDAGDEPASKLLKRIEVEKALLVSEGKLKPSKMQTKIAAKEDPFELPKGWAWSTLAEVALINPRNSAEDGLVVSFVPMTLIGTSFHGVHAQESRLWGEVKQGFTHFAEGDIGVAKITPCFENSKACVFFDLKNGLGAGTTELHIVRPMLDTVEPRYVLAYVKSPQFLRVGETKMTGTAGQKRLPKDFVEANPFPVPPLAEQRRIVAKVDELMALCDQLEARQADAENAHAQLVEALLNSLTQARDADDFAASWQRLSEHFHTLFTTESSIDALKQAVLQLAVMGKLVPQDAGDEPAARLLKRIAEKDEWLGTKARKQSSEAEEVQRPFELPTGWEWSRLSDLKPEFQNGASSRGDSEGVPVTVLRLADIKTGEICLDDTRILTLSAETVSKYALEVGDVLIIRVNGSADLVGRFVVCRTAPQVIPCDHFIRMRFPSGVVEPTYLKLVGDSEVARVAIAGLFVSTAGQKTVNQGHIGSLLLPLPPFTEQHRIVAKVDQLMVLCDQLKSRLIQARQLNEQLATTLVERAVA